MVCLDNKWPPRRQEVHFDGRRMLCFQPRPAGFHRMLEEAVARKPRGEALVCDKARLTYASLDREVGRLAAGLAAYGVGCGDRVALLVGNRAEFVVAVFAASRLGAIWIPLNVRDRAAGIAHMLNDSGAKVLIAEHGLAERVPQPAATPALAHRFLIDGKQDGFAPYDSLLDSGTVVEAVETGEDDTVAIFYTSGTTGLPKGAMATNLGLVHSAMHYEAAMDLNHADRSVAAVPLGHITGAVANLAAMVRVAGTLILMPVFKAADFLQLAATERMTHTVLVPAQYNLCLLQPGHRDHDLSAWRIGGFGGAPMPVVTIERIANWLPGLKLMNLYGATETTSPTTIMPADEIAARPDSVGLPVGCGSVRIVDDEGRDLPSGETGEIWIAGPMVVPGYWSNPQATAGEFTGGYWHSGDLGSMDAEGFVRVFDRKKDVINRGGYKIFSAEVENVLVAHPAVVEAAVVAVPCPVLGERVHAFVVAGREEIETGDLAAFCAARLADYKVPESFTVQDEPLPRNPNGKLIKWVLREALCGPTATP
jgi:long-chain acyl-CoA synthetase